MTDEQWGWARPLIQAAIETSPGFENIEDVERLLAGGTYQAWFGARSCAITEIVSYARRKVLNVVHGGGDLDELLEELEPKMCAFARAQGCDGIMGVGRKGWERVTRKRGYRFAYVAMIKDFETVPLDALRRGR